LLLDHRSGRAEVRQWVSVIEQEGALRLTPVEIG
jgi:hypothetical protein